MTTFEPGASDVLTHGRRCGPLSTGLRASRAAPIITEGFEVLVHEVIAAIVTAPWSSSSWVPSDSVTGVGCVARPPGSTGWRGTGGRSASPFGCSAGGSEAGKDSLSDSSDCEGAAPSEAELPRGTPDAAWPSSST